MYKSPIEIMTSSINYRLEEEVLKAVAKVDVDVNKDELVKALDYDRGQYEKGYADAKAEYEREQGEWIFDPEILCSDIGVYSAGYRCSVCGKDYFKVDRMNYCPNCGARMNSAVHIARKEQTMRLIDADALHNALKAKQKWVVRCGDKHNEGYTYDQVHFAIDEAPSIETKQVKYYDEDENLWKVGEVIVNE